MQVSRMGGGSSWAEEGEEGGAPLEQVPSAMCSVCVCAMQLVEIQLYSHFNSKFEVFH